jgi:hypothetical protein
VRRFPVKRHARVSIKRRYKTLHCRNYFPGGV